MRDFEIPVIRKNLKVADIKFLKTSMNAWIKFPVFDA